MLSLLLLAAAPLAAPACPIDKAVYRLADAPEYSAGFAPQERRKRVVSDLVLWVKTPKRTYWFSFQAPNGYGGTYISPDIDPAASARMSDDEEADAADKREGAEPVMIEFDAFDGNLKASKTPPQAADKAPALLFARGLGPALWYNPAGLAGSDATAAQESMPIGFFRASGCSK
jgi:hypothetical protein